MENIKKIGPFIFDDSKTTMEYGFYYKADLVVPFDEAKRTIRVWLPEDYDFFNQNKRFPVIYFSDGQNLVNEYLTAFGCWELDKVAHKLFKNENISFIAIGIDSPKEHIKRENELNPPIVPKRKTDINHPMGDVFINYIVNELKPLIDEVFFTKSDLKNTAVAGSSMGGIMAFYAGATNPNVFSFSLDFSPAFLVYPKKQWKEILDSLDFNKAKNHQFYLYVGGKGFEKSFIKHVFMTFSHLIEHGIDINNIGFLCDKKMPHHEIAWNKYLYDAIYFWLK